MGALQAHTQEGRLGCLAGALQAHTQKGRLGCLAGALQAHTQGGEVGRSSRGSSGPYPGGEVGRSSGGSSGPYPGGDVGGSGGGSSRPYTGGGWGVSRPLPWPGGGECVSQLALRQYTFYWNTFLFVNTFPFVYFSFCLDTTAKLEHSQCPLVETDFTTFPLIFLSLIMNLAILTSM